MAYESGQPRRGHRLHRVVARHRETGRLAGQTVVAVEVERPDIGHQHDTSVCGHTAAIGSGCCSRRRCCAGWPRCSRSCETIDTWNAESNEHMIGVNEMLGYEVLERAVSPTSGPL